MGRPSDRAGGVPSYSAFHPQASKVCMTPFLSAEYMGQEAGGVEVHERTPWVGRQTARAVSPHTLPLTPKHQMCA